MAAWLYPLSPNDFQHADGTWHWLCDDNWCPPETALCLTKAGSMAREIIINVVCHNNSRVRKTVPQDEHILLFVEGHSSLEGLQWTETCKRLNIVAVQLPANMTHMLQPCDRKTNKVFQQEIRRIRDLLLNMSHLSRANTAVKIKLAVAAHKALTPDIARASFFEAGLCPMDFRFMSFLDDNSPRKCSSEPRGSHKRRSGMLQDTNNSNVSRRVASIRLMKIFILLQSVSFLLLML